MESWSVDFLKVMEAMAKELEEFVAGVAQDINEVVEAVTVASEDMVTQIQIVFENEIEPQLVEFFDPILEAYLGFEIAIEETAQPVIHTVEPLINDHPVCAGCRHYHGQMYGGNMLVCGMHPYGWEGEKCPDWESTWNE